MRLHCGRIHTVLLVLSDGGAWQRWAQVPAGDTEGRGGDFR